MRVLKVKVISLPYIFQVLYVLCFARPRYQVSVYRTNGPLVDVCHCIHGPVEICKSNTILAPGSNDFG